MILPGTAVLHEVAADDRGDDRHAAKRQRIYRRGAGVGLHQQRAKQHRRDDGHSVGLEQVGCHASAVAHVVTDVVGNHGGVTGIVFRNAGFDLADEVSANVRAFGEDAAAKTRENRDQRGPKAKPISGDIRLCRSSFIMFGACAAVPIRNQ